LGSVSVAPAAREPHPEARADGPAPVQRDWQRLFRRGSAPRSAVAGAPYTAARAGGDRAALSGDPRDAAGLDRTPTGRGWRRLPGEGHRLPRKDGRARQISPTLPRLRRAGPADRVLGERMQLLSPLPERRQAAGGPGVVAGAA